MRKPGFPKVKQTFTVPFILSIALSFMACASTARIARHLDRTWDTPGMDYQFTGLLMIDADSGDTLYTRNAKKAFTPASNMKLFTLYAAIKTLPEQAPAMKYAYRGDTLVVAGTGDPSALHHELRDSTALEFMDKAPHVAMANTHMKSLVYGPGWSWDDFDRYYMPSRSAFPIYGNVVKIAAANTLRVVPDILKDSVIAEAHMFRRAPETNLFFVNPTLGDTLEIPFVTDPAVERRFWGKALGKPVYATEYPMDSLQTLYGIPTDSLYERLMKESDNFIAEQLMLMVSTTLGDSLSFERARNYALDSLLSDLPQQPRWVDGSGLSRYNLVSPEAIVHLLGKLYREIPRERLFKILAAGGQAGTLEGRYKDGPQPYLYGKTGSLSNNHNLSGYLLTRSGKTVIFSFMNNHYQQPTSQIASRMERVLKWVRDQY